jgi:hypothetical protein
MLCCCSHSRILNMRSTSSLCLVNDSRTSMETFMTAKLKKDDWCRHTSVGNIHPPHLRTLSTSPTLKARIPQQALENHGTNIPGSELPQQCCFGIVNVCIIRTNKQHKNDSLRAGLRLGLGRSPNSDWSSPTRTQTKAISCRQIWTRAEVKYNAFFSHVQGWTKRWAVHWQYIKVNLRRGESLATIGGCQWSVDLQGWQRQRTSVLYSIRHDPVTCVDRLSCFALI